MSDHWRLILNNGNVLDVRMGSNALHPMASCLGVETECHRVEHETVTYLAHLITTECPDGVWVEQIVAPGVMTPEEREFERCVAFLRNESAKINAKIQTCEPKRAFAMIARQFALTDATNKLAKEGTR